MRRKTIRESTMVEIDKKEKAIAITGICTNCGSRKNCDFTRNINTYVRDNRCAKRISDVEITVYSCENYEAEIEKICDDSEMCLYCRQEE